MKTCCSANAIDGVSHTIDCKKPVHEYKVVITEEPFVYYIKATGKAEAEELAQMEHFDARIGELYSIKVKKMNK
jgi:hypothetical protein